MTPNNAYQFSFESLENKKLFLKDYKDKVILIVNTASKCGFTPQYVQLEELYQKFNKKNFEIIAIPSNDFGKQEFCNPIEIKDFINSNYKISFQITKIEKIKGKDSHPFFNWARDQVGILGSPKWNFHKYLIDSKGNLADWYSSIQNPTSNKIITKMW